MGEAQQAEPRKPRPTLRQERLAKASLTAKTKTQAMLEAGYSPATARAAAGRQLNLAGTRAALEVLNSGRRDSAAVVHEITGKEIVSRVQRGDASDALIAHTWKSSKEMIDASAGTEQLVTGSDIEDAKAYTRRVVRACFAAALANGQSDNLDLDDLTIDTIAVRCESPEFTYCALSDAIPPTPIEQPITIDAEVLPNDQP